MNEISEGKRKYNPRTNRTHPIVWPLSLDETLVDHMLKHRHITKVPTVRHVRALIQADMEANPTLYGIEVVILQKNE